MSRTVRGAPFATLARAVAAASVLLAASSTLLHAQRYTATDGRLRVALARQPFSPNGTSRGPQTMAEGGIQDVLAGMGAVVRVTEAALTVEEATEYGGWKRLGMALGQASAIGFATIPSEGPGGLGLAAVNRMIAGAVAGVRSREAQR